MDYVLQSYGKDKCCTVFNAGVKVLPRRENKVHHSTFVTEYIKTLGLGNLDIHIDGVGDRAPPPPNCPKKKGLS